MCYAKIKIAWVNFFSFVELHGPNKTKGYLLMYFLENMTE